MTRCLAVLVSAAALACAPPSAPPGGGDGGPGGDAGSGDGGPGTDGGLVTADERSCETVFRVAPTGPVTGVRVAGSWDWSAPEALEPDGAGGFALAKTLDPGLYAYKYVVDRPTGSEWILDPENPYRAYDGGVENSGARVPDCTVPLLELRSFERTTGGASARVEVLRAAGGPAIDPGAVRVERVSGFASTDVAAAFDGAEIAVDATGLEPGKHTLVIGAADAAGAAAEPLRLPFWVEDEPFEWRDAVIYMMMIDRFVDGDPDNNPARNPEVPPTADFHGGDLAGITRAIEDGVFDELGVRALWLSPLATNPGRAESEFGRKVTAYHGYLPIRGREVDPRFGTAEELEALVAAAHARGIRVLLDYVINHVHIEHEYYASNPAWFRTGCACGSAGCDWTERRLDCLFHPWMPDIDWSNRDAGEAIVADALWWLERFDLDGLRVDAVKHVEDAAVFNLSTRVHERLEQAGTEYFLLGETAMGWSGHDLDANAEQYATISRYIGPFALSGQFDFVLYHSTSYNVFADERYGMVHADYWTRASLEAYPAAAVMTPYIGSHDTQRFLSLADTDSGIVYNQWPEQGLPQRPEGDLAYDRMRVAMAWLLTIPGAPLLYYGDEYGEFGGSDPDNRHMWRPEGERDARERAQHNWVAALGQARAASEALRRGDYTTLAATEHTLAFARHTAGDLAVVALNRSAAPAAIDVTGLDALGVPVPDTLHDAVDPDGTAVDVLGGAAATIPVPPYSARVLVP